MPAVMDFGAVEQGLDRVFKTTSGKDTRLQRLRRNGLPGYERLESASSAFA